MEANKIKTARLTSGMSQEKAASLLQFPLRTWKNWEEGKTQPPAYIETLIIKRLQNCSAPNDR